METETIKDRSKGRCKMKHYITISLDIEHNNIIIMGFDSERKADNAIEKLESYEDNHHECKWFSVDDYGKCEEYEVRSWCSEKNIIKLIDRKTPLTTKEISAMCKELWEAYNG